MAASETDFRNFLSVGTITQNVEGGTLASAATMAPTHSMHYVTGTSEVSLITLPYTGFAGTVTFLPADAFTGATGGTPTSTNKPLAHAFTAVAGQALRVTYSPSQAKWYPASDA